MDSCSATPCGGEGKGPKIRVCYVCGRGYGLSSYEIHLKQCKAKWEAQQEALPKSERKPLPKEPIIDSDGLGSGGALSLDAQNEAATQVFNTEALESCEHCGRTFLKDRLRIHQKSCTSSSPAKAIGSARLSSSSPQAPANTIPRPQTSGSKKHTSEASNGERSQAREGDVPSQTAATGQHEGGGALAGNYGGIARHGSRGLHGDHAPKRDNVDDLKNRIDHVELELANTKIEVDELRKVVENLHLQALGSSL